MMSRKIRTVFAMVCVAAGSSAQAKTYECQLNAPLALYRDGNSATLKEINFQGLENEPWKFEIYIKEGKKGELDNAVVDWPTNPIQIAGEFPVLPTATGAIAFTATGFGGCMFTVDACLATVQIADQESGKAKISVLPTALWTDEAANRSDPFVALIDGTCTWKNSK